MNESYAAPLDAGRWGHLRWFVDLNAHRTSGAFHAANVDVRVRVWFRNGIVTVENGGGRRVTAYVDSDLHGRVYVESAVRMRGTDWSRVDLPGRYTLPCRVTVEW